MSAAFALYTLDWNFLFLPAPLSTFDWTLFCEVCNGPMCAPQNKLIPWCLTFWELCTNCLMFLSLLDVSKPVDAVFSALFLFAFFTLARKYNLVADVVCGRGRQILCRDVCYSRGGLLVVFHWTKTIQDRSRTLSIPLVSIPGPPLCPLHVYCHMLRLVPALSSNLAFVLPTSSSLRAVTYADFMLVLRHLVGAVGFDPNSFSSHSFRRGGTTFAFQAGVPAPLIQIQGDWASSAFLEHIDMYVERRRLVGSKIVFYLGIKRPSILPWVARTGVFWCLFLSMRVWCSEICFMYIIHMSSWISSFGGGAFTVFYSCMVKFTMFRVSGASPASPIALCCMHIVKLSVSFLYTCNLFLFPTSFECGKVNSLLGPVHFTVKFITSFYVSRQPGLNRLDRKACDRDRQHRGGSLDWIYNQWHDRSDCLW